MKYKNLYVAATSQHVGKTTSTLGLVSCFTGQGLKVGYCKPVGQKVLDIADLRVDKDTILFSDLIDFQIIPELHSPIILGKGATEKVIDNPDKYGLEDRILNAAAKLDETNDLVIFEGTGHPGVGSVAGLSNAKVAKLVDAGVIMIVEGGIGSTIDMLNMCSSLFREENVPIIGVIINKVRPEKMEKVKNYVGKWLERQGIPLLGLLPYDRTLAFPIMRSIAKAVQGTITYNADHSDNRIDSILAGSLIDLQELKSSEDLLLVVSTGSINQAVNKIKQITELNGIDHCPLSGIVATGQGNFEGDTLRYIEENNLPLVRTDLDTYGAVIKISNIEVKINQKTPWKVKKAISLIEQNVDLNKIVDKIKM